MRTNGTIQYLTQEGGQTFDEYGIPTMMQDAWSEPVPCWIKTNKNSTQGRYEDGKFLQFAFTITAETDTLPAELAGLARVKISRRGISLGEFEVQGIPEQLSAGRTLINI